MKFIELTMDYVVLCLIVFIIIKSDAAVSTKDNPRIIITRSYSSTIDQAAYYTVVMNKPLDIHFQNMSVSRGWCVNYHSHDKNLDKWELPLLDNPSTIHFEKVSSDMSVLWKCNVTEDQFDYSHWDLRKKYYVYYLKLHVKGAKSVEMTIDDNKVSFSPVDLSVPYDGHSVYLYEDGEHVHIVCRNPQKTGAVYLEHFTKGNGVTNASMSSNLATFDIQLNSGSDRSYIDCVYATAELDRYVYRVIFATKKPSIYSTESTTLTDVIESANQDSDGKSSPLLLGSSIGAVLVLLAVAVTAFCIIRTRNAKLIEMPYADISNKSDIPTSQHAKKNENQYDVCHYSDHLSNRDTVLYNTPESAEDVDPKYHQYTEIDYLTCKPKICETQIRNSRVYDEPYVQITMSATVQTLKRI